jgi:hypothetical protein
VHVARARRDRRSRADNYIASPPSQPFGAAKFPLLNALLDEAGIKLVDIGGRGSALPSLLCPAPFSGYSRELAALFGRVSIVDTQDATRLADEMRRTCRDSTRHMTRKAQEEGLGQALLAPSFRDKTGSNGQ